MDLKENIEKLEKKIEHNAGKIESNKEKIHQNTGAIEVLHTIKAYTNLFFTMWLITFIAFIVLLCYTIKTINDTETITTTTTQEVEQENESGSNNFIGGNGDISG